MTLFSFLLLFSAYIVYTTAAPSLETRRRHELKLQVLHGKGTMEPVLSVDFPDPSIIQDEDDGTWYAFSTSSKGTNIQVAHSRGSNPFAHWRLLDIDALPLKGWTRGLNTWAPDVSRLGDGSYIMYFAGQVHRRRKHCIGVARSDFIAGPYIPEPVPWYCPGGGASAIDPAGFHDRETGKRYVVYKDGNNPKSPLMLQEVGHDGVKKIGAARSILDRIPDDGPLIEAPFLTRREDGTYILFFSSHHYKTPAYDTKYAWSNDIKGPYTRAAKPLLQTPDFELDGPGGMSAYRTKDGENIMAFHGWCKKGARCLYVSKYGVEK